MIAAYTRAVSPEIARCELTHVARQPIDVTRAIDEHADYELALADLGASVRRVAATPELPDSAFVEDTAIVLDEIAVISRPGAVSRRSETASVAAVLARHRRLAEIAAPGTLDGGDVLVAGRDLYVGQSSRTNRAATDQLRELLGPLGYRVTAVTVARCLHLKNAVTRVAEDRLLLNPAWVDARRFDGWHTIEVDPDEPGAANALPLGDGVIHPRHYPRTRARLEAVGLRVVPVAMDELAKAEAGVTCCSIIVGEPRLD
jgi:dimethylargininase